MEIPDTTKSYILELLNDKKAVISTEVITKNREITYANYKVGSYFTRVIYDENKNGKWDTGSLKLGTQPEPTWNNPEERTNRANFLVNLIFVIPPPPQKNKSVVKDKTPDAKVVDPIVKPKN